jgi:hypothetical protein
MQETKDGDFDGTVAELIAVFFGEIEAEGSDKEWQHWVGK